MPRKSPKHDRGKKRFRSSERIAKARPGNGQSAATSPWYVTKGREKRPWAYSRVSDQRLVECIRRVAGWSITV